MVTDGCLLMAFTVAHYVASNMSFLISSAATVSSVGGPGLSFEQVLKYLMGNLAGPCKGLKRREPLTIEHIHSDAQYEHRARFGMFKAAYKCPCNCNYQKESGA